MALDAALVELRDQLVRLKELLRAVRGELRKKCPHRAHWVASRIDDTHPVVVGWLRKALGAAGSGCPQRGKGRAGRS